MSFTSLYGTCSEQRLLWKQVLALKSDQRTKLPRLESTFFLMSRCAWQSSTGLGIQVCLIYKNLKSNRVTLFFSTFWSLTWLQGRWTLLIIESRVSGSNHCCPIKDPTSRATPTRVGDSQDLSGGWGPLAGGGVLKGVQLANIPIT